MSVIRARIDSTLGASRPDHRRLALDSMPLTVGASHDCVVRMEPAGVTVELNESDEPWLLTVTSPSSPDGSWGPTISLRFVRHGARAAITGRRIQ